MRQPMKNLVKKAEKKGAKSGVFIFKVLGTFVIVLLLIANQLGCSRLNGSNRITGTWEFSITTADGYWQYTKTLVFSGSDARGTVIESDRNSRGDYRVKDDNLEFTLPVFYGSEQWRGTYTGGDNMNGTWVSSSNSRGTWAAVRR